MKLNEETPKGTTFFRNIRKGIGSYYFRGFSLKKKLKNKLNFLKAPKVNNYQDMSGSVINCLFMQI